MSVLESSFIVYVPVCPDSTVLKQETWVGEVKREQNNLVIRNFKGEIVFTINDYESLIQLGGLAFDAISKEKSLSGKMKNQTGNEPMHIDKEQR